MTGLDQERTEERTLFPAPADGAELGINPDGFVWLPVDGAAAYELEVRTAGGNLALRERVSDHYYVPGQPFPPGEYSWVLRAFDAGGAPVGEREPWTFTVPDDVPTSVCPSARAVLEDVDDAHPRLVYRADGIEGIRERVRADQGPALEALAEIVEDAYEMGMPPRPEFHLEDTERLRRQRYQDYFGELREYVDRNLRACALYHLLTGDERPGEFARRMLLHVCGWNPAGPNSVRRHWGDEPGLSYARVLPECYDWTYDRYDDDEREYVERTLVQYTRQTYDRLRDGGFFRNPATSHLARLPGYLGEQVLLLTDRLDDGEAEEMLQYALDVFNTFYPHWGGEDGGWAEGVPYGQWYNRWYVPFFATMERQTGFSFWDRPFYRKVREFFVYCALPNAGAMPFGDGQAENRPGKTLNCLLELWAARYGDDIAAWRAGQIDAEGYCLADMMGTIYSPHDGGTADPPELPDSKLFGDVGWAALHSDLARPEADNALLFRSSPYGNVSHSHNNQNAFCLAAGGRMLAISSGYYPSYGCPHHAEWTRETRAHNSVLVDGEGQERGVTATGEIAAFDDGEGYTYLCGTAAGAYPAPLERFDRHVLFVDPGLYLIYDDLAAATPAAFGWLLHTREAPTIATGNDRVEIEASRGDARMDVRLFSAGGLAVEHTDAFDPPVNEGLIEELREDRPDQHHVTAETDPRERARILAVVDVGRGGDGLDVDCERAGDAIRIAAPKAGFAGEATVAGGTALRGEIERDGGVETVDVG